MDSELFPDPIANMTPTQSPKAASPLAAVKRAVRNRLKLGILLFVLAAPVAVGLAVWKSAPYYEAEAVVEVHPIRPRILYNTNDNEPGRSYESFFQTQMAKVSSDVVLSKCIDDPSVRNTPLFRNATTFRGRPNPLRVLRGALTVKRIENTQLFSVSVRADSPDGLATIVNAVIREYRAYVDQADAVSENRRLQVLDAERKKLRLEVDTKMSALAKVREGLAGDPNGAPGSLSRDPVSVTQEAIIEAKTQRAAAKARLERLQAAPEAGAGQVVGVPVAAALVDDPDLRHLIGGSQTRREFVSTDAPPSCGADNAKVQEMMESDPSVKSLREEIAKQELDLAVMSQTLQDSNPALRRLRITLQTNRERLDQLENELVVKITKAVRQMRQDARAEDIRKLEGDVEGLAIREAALQDLLKTQVEQRAVYERKAAELRSREEDLKRSQQSLAGVEQRLHELEVESGAPGFTSIASTAIEPKAPEPYLARCANFIAVAVAGAAGLVLLCLVLLDRRDDTIWTPDDMHYAVGAEMLGCVPDGGPALGGPVDGTALVCRREPYSLFAEQLRNVMAGVLYPADGKPARTVLVTGAAPGDGKTTLAANLATCVAGLGKRVLLIDANFRKPDLARVFNLGNIPGLGDILAYGADPQQIVHHVDIPNLNVLSAGSPPSCSAGMLGSNAMRETLKHFSAEYEYVIIDGPPLMLADARILAPMVDGVVCSFRALASQRAAVEQSITTLRRLGARTIGVALMGVSSKHVGYQAAIKALDAYTHPAQEAHVTETA